MLIYELNEAVVETDWLFVLLCEVPRIEELVQFIVGDELGQ
jgi:hypothetical protein